MRNCCPPAHPGHSAPNTGFDTACLLPNPHLGRFRKVAVLRKRRVLSHDRQRPRWECFRHVSGQFQTHRTRALLFAGVEPVGQWNELLRNQGPRQVLGGIEFSHALAASFYAQNCFRQGHTMAGNRWEYSVGFTDSFPECSQWWSIKWHPCAGTQCALFEAMWSQISVMDAASLGLAYCVNIQRTKYSSVKYAYAGFTFLKAHRSS